MLKELVEEQMRADNDAKIRAAALEEALQAMQQVLAEHSLGLDYAEDGRYTWPERWVALEKKIRALKEAQ